MQVKIVGQAVMGYVIEHGAQLKGLYLSLERGGNRQPPNAESTY